MTQPPATCQQVTVGGEFGRFCGLISCRRTFEFKGPAEWQLVGAFSPGLLTNRVFYSIKNSSIWSPGHPWFGCSPTTLFWRKRQQTEVVKAGGDVHSWVPSSSLRVLTGRRIKRNHIAVLTQCLLDTHVPRVSDDRAIKTELDRLWLGISAQRSRSQQKERKKSALTSRVGPVLDLRRFRKVRLLFHFDFCHSLRSSHF